MTRRPKDERGVIVQSPIGEHCNSGVPRNLCRCDNCQRFRDELEHWNRRLAREGLPLARGTSRYTVQQHRKRTKQSQAANETQPRR